MSCHINNYTPGPSLSLSQNQILYSLSVFIPKLQHEPTFLYSSTHSLSLPESRSSKSRPSSHSTRISLVCRTRKALCLRARSPSESPLNAIVFCVKVNWNQWIYSYFWRITVSRPRQYTSGPLLLSFILVEPTPHFNSLNDSILYLFTFFTVCLYSFF